MMKGYKIRIGAPLAVIKFDYRLYSLDPLSGICTCRGVMRKSNHQSIAG